MSAIPFFKYQGTGNDFVMIDNREVSYLTRKDTDRIQKICDRRFGVGADGLILLQDKPGYDFEMVYFNADGRESTMCGNGGRCVVAFAKRLGIIEDRCKFLAIDGPHDARILDNGWVELKMSDVREVEAGEDYFLLDTGSPHYVIFVEDLSDINVVRNGAQIRYSDRFRKKGVNVNFVEKQDTGIAVATYERGVEDETLSCGTGVTAAAISWVLKRDDGEQQEVPIHTKGGDLKVRLERKGDRFANVWLCGPATFVYSGQL